MSFKKLVSYIDSDDNGNWVLKTADICNLSERDIMNLYLSSNPDIDKDLHDYIRSIKE